MVWLSSHKASRCAIRQLCRGLLRRKYAIMRAASGNKRENVESETGRDMENANTKLKVYCETSFWSWLVSRPSTNPDHAVKQAWTRKWWAECAPGCELYVSGFVATEAASGDSVQSSMRLAEISKCRALDSGHPAVDALAKELLRRHAIPEKEVADAFHVATAAVYGMDMLLTWNCRHMANLHTLPKTATIVAMSGYDCPKILTPRDAMEGCHD